MVAKQKSVPPRSKPPVEIDLPDPSPNGRLGWLIGLIAGVVFLAVSAYVAAQQLLPGIEERALRFINNWPDSLRPVFLVGTIAPESLWIAVAAVAITFFLKLYRLAWQLAAAVIISYGAAFLIKQLIARARPEEILNGISIRAAESGLGFPSMHATIITVVVLVILPYLPKALGLGILVLVPIVGLSRIYLGVHSPLDVVGGVALGLIVVSLMRVLPVNWREKMRFD